MPRIEVDGEMSFVVANGTRLVRAIEDNGIDILHRCGGFAKCTTCRVEFLEGEPDRMTQAEHDRLQRDDLLGKVRLSCQILCDDDIKVHVVNRLHTSGLPDPGSQPEEYITPEPQWIAAPNKLESMAFDAGE
jgi:ferredoxin